MLDIRKYTGGIADTNAWFLALEAGPGLLVDAPEGVGDWLEAEGLRVGTLLLTHHHFDHIMDAARVQREHGARVCSYAAPEPALTLESLFRGFAGSGFAIESFAPEQLLEGEARLSVASEEARSLDFALLHVPGHSADSVCFHLPDAKILFAGDTLFEGSIGRSDFPGGDGELLVRGIREKILVLDPATRVLPGHGDETTVGDEARGNPYL